MEENGRGRGGSDGESAGGRGTYKEKGYKLYFSSSTQLWLIVKNSLKVVNYLTKFVLKLMNTFRNSSGFLIETKTIFLLPKMVFFTSINEMKWKNQRINFLI